MTTEHGMRRVMTGLYQGDDVRCEKVDGLWRFDLKCNQLGLLTWYEYHPAGAWTPIGKWRTIDAGLAVADRLRSGVSFWDADLQRTRAYDEEVYALLRQFPGN